jgi:acyl-CoA thioester hydrolase
MGGTYTHRVDVRYLEVDRQGVVFNMWYLAYFDDAMSGLLAHGGVPYPQLLAEGYDVMLVHTELDWTAGVGFGDDVRVEVSTERIGTTSFTLGFAVLRGTEVVCRARTVYVAVAVKDYAKREIPTRLRAALAIAEGATTAGAPADAQADGGALQPSGDTLTSS